jgi:hypothetical protein
MLEWKPGLNDFVDFLLFISYLLLFLNDLLLLLLLASVVAIEVLADFVESVFFS